MDRASKILTWTRHAKAKMAFYKLSPQRVRHVLHSPRRIEEGVAPKTLAMMSPASIKMKKDVIPAKAGIHDPRDKSRETWTHEIWVMVEDFKDQRIVISAWRYPGITKPKSEAAFAEMRRQYEEYKKNNE